ncbi:hypothetical protein HKCCE4037_04880 [Rhodobacterales bacterium HKCCE4037]|nr:hypothetical protein [Rhodobacterales bacterium HKCCE4037]
MTKDLERLQRLRMITSLLAERALAPVSAAGNAMRQIESRASALGDHRADLLDAGTDPVLAGTMLAQAERLRQLQAAALRDLATARVTFEQEKAKAKRDVGRDLALRKLIEKRTAEVRMEAARRKSR